MENRKTYSLSAGQKLVLLSEKYTIHKQLMNVPTSCFLDAELDLDILKKAAAEAVQRNDVFGVRITKIGKEDAQYFTDRNVLTLETVDFSGQTVEAMEKFLVKIGRTKMKMFDNPLCRIYIVKSPDGKSGLFVCNSHIIMDSWAVSMFYKDIFEVYYALKNNTPMPKPIPSYEAALQKELAYPTSEKHEKDIEFWKQELSVSTPIFTHVNGRRMLEKWRKFKRDPDHRFGRSIYFRTTAKHVVHMVDKKDVEAMRTFCEENRIPSPQVLFFMGVRTAIAILNDREKDVSLFLIAARRATLEEKSCGGTRALSLPLRSIMEDDLTFLDALNMLLDKQNILFRHADLDTVEFFKLQRSIINMAVGETYIALHFTFQPVQLTLHDGIKTNTKWYCNGAAASNLGLSVMDGDGTGSLRCYYEYLDKVIKPQTLDILHSYMLKVIMTGIQNPSIQMKDLMDAVVK